MSEENADLHETKFDAIVLGTGLVESITAGALARAGKNVLHLDSNDHYGGTWSVFGFKELLKWCQKVRNPGGDAPSKANDKEIVYQSNVAANYKNIRVDIPESRVNPSLFMDDSAENIEERLSNDEAAADALRQSRLYNLDLAPKLLSCEGELVEILIRSGVGRYLEFKGVDDIFMLDEKTKRLEKVPSSREDVFGNKSITLVDKRKLMRFLTFAVNYQEEPETVEGYHDKPFATFLQEKFKISGQLLTALVYATALVDTKAATVQGLKRTQQFMKSLGRFTKGGFLCTLYGGGSEIAQAFCRVCAVYGGIYVLNQPLSSFSIKDGKCTGVLTADGKKFEADKVIASVDYLPRSWLPEAASSWPWISRAIVVTDKPLAVSEDAKGPLHFSVIPPINGIAASNPVYAIHQNSESMACPGDQYVTYLWKVAEAEEQDLRPVVDVLLSSQPGGAVSAKYVVYYQQREQRVNVDKQEWKIPVNIVACGGPTRSLDFEDAVNEARDVFLQCVPPGTEFMPSQEEDIQDEE